MLFHFFSVRIERQTHSYSERYDWCTILSLQRILLHNRCLIGHLNSKSEEQMFNSIENLGFLHYCIQIIGLNITTSLHIMILNTKIMLRKIIKFFYGNSLLCEHLYLKPTIYTTEHVSLSQAYAWGKYRLRQALCVILCL